MESKAHNTFIDSVQIGRAFAAMAVALQHTIRDADRYYPQFTDTNPAYTSNPDGWVELMGAGVDVFFVISGVVMVLSTWHGHGSIGLFLYRRASRIYPIYWLLTIAFIALLLAAPNLFKESSFEPVHAACSLLLIPCTNPSGEAIPYIYAGWTLTYELVFYGLFALSLLAPGKWSKLASCIVLILAYHSLYYTSLSSIPAIQHSASNIILEFIYGLLLAYAYMHFSFQRQWAWPLLVAGCAFLLISHTGQFTEWPRFIRWGLPACLVVAGLMCANQPRSVQSRMYKSLVFLGAASYSLYLFHFFSLKLFFVLAGKLGILALLSPALSVAAAFIVTLFASLVLYQFCELPLTRLSKLLWQNTATRKART